MSTYPPPIREREVDPELSPGWPATVAAGFVLMLAAMAVELTGHATNAPGIVSALDGLVDGEHLIAVFVGLFALGAFVQGYRWRWLRRRGFASAGFSRALDWALTVLGAIALIPALEPHPDKWTDPRFYPFCVFGVLMVAFSVACVRRRA